MRLVTDIFNVGKEIYDDIKKFNIKLARVHTAAAKKTLTGFKADLRSATSAAGLGHRMENTWQGQVFPSSGVSADPAVLLFSKAPNIIAAFDQGVTIKSKNGFFLCIPTDYVGYTNGRRMNPRNFEEAGIPLRYVPPAGGRRYALLVVDNFRINSKGNARAASNTAISKGKTATVVMFILLRQVTLTKKMDVKSLSQKWMNEFLNLINESFSDV